MDIIKVKDKQCLISPFTIKYATKIISFDVLVEYAFRYNATQRAHLLF